MKVTIHIPDKLAQQLSPALQETGARDLNEMFTRAVFIYLYTFRRLSQGWLWGFFNQANELESKLFDLRGFGQLFHEEDADTDAASDEQPSN